MAVENPESLHYVEGDMERMEAMGSETYYRQLGGSPEAGMQAHDTHSGASIRGLTGSGPAQLDSPLDFLERTAAEAMSSGDRIREVSARSRNLIAYPASRLATDLKLVARLIAGGLRTRIYYVSHGGFDTHAHQLPTHQRLLGELGDATRAFLTDLKAMSHLDRVVLMTFSEFGRRVQENANEGTDHGAAAPLFIAGGRVRPGIHGVTPSLAPGNLLNGDVRYSTDFRSVFSTLLEGWLRTPAAPILGGDFERVNFLA